MHIFQDLDTEMCSLFLSGNVLFGLSSFVVYVVKRMCVYSIYRPSPNFY